MVDITKPIKDNRRRLDNIQSQIDTLSSSDIAESINFGDQEFSLRTDIELTVINDDTSDTVNTQTLANNLKCTNYGRQLLINILSSGDSDNLSNVVVGTGESSDSRRTTEQLDEPLNITENVDINRTNDELTISADVTTNELELSDLNISELGIITDKNELIQYTPININTAIIQSNL